VNYNEVVIVPTFQRPELLHLCLSQIRQLEPNIPISVFPDRGTAKDREVLAAVEPFLATNLQLNFVPDHDYYGNSFNTMEAFRWAYNDGWDRIYLIEDDVIVHPEFFPWHREIHNDEDFDIFASMAWIFNRHAPIADGVFFQPWYYSIGTCFKRHKLGLVVEHACPRYYGDMAKYVGDVFSDTPLNQSRKEFGIEHYEQDGLIQRVLDRDKSQTASPGIAKCSHVGLFGYNRGWYRADEFFANCGSFDERVQRLATFIEDPYERAQVFGRDIVEREMGYELPKREIRYRAKLREWETEFVSEVNLTPKTLPTRVNSVPVSAEMLIEQTS
jgi:hypothetical protein